MRGLGTLKGSAVICGSGFAFTFLAYSCQQCFSILITGGSRIWQWGIQLKWSRCLLNSEHIEHRSTDWSNTNQKWNQKSQELQKKQSAKQTYFKTLPFFEYLIALPSSTGKEFSLNSVLRWPCPLCYYFLAQHIGHLRAKTQVMLKVQLLLPFGNASFLIVI